MFPNLMTPIDFSNAITSVAAVVVPVATLFYFIVRITVKSAIEENNKMLMKYFEETYRRNSECELIISRERHDQRNFMMIKLLEKQLGKDTEPQQPAGMT